MPKARAVKHSRPSKGSAGSGPFDIAGWATTYRRPNRRCETCESQRHVLEPIRTAIRAANEAGVPISPKGLWRVLREHYAYRLGDGALKNHLRDCEGYGARKA